MYSFLSSCYPTFSKGCIWSDCIFLTPSRKWVRGPFIPCQITEEKQLLQVTSAHDSGPGAALFLPRGFRKDFWAANPGHAGTTQSVCKQLRHAPLATQSIFPSRVSLNKVELASISSGLGPFGVMYSKCLCTSCSSALIPALLIHIIQKSRLTPLARFTASFLPFFLSPSFPPFFPSVF